MEKTKKDFEYKIEYYNELGQLHRTDGPAVEYINGYCFWYLNGKSYTEQRYNIESLKFKNEKNII